MRYEFSKSTKRIIASRAGNECSYLNCRTRTGGPDLLAGATLQAGIAAHIYSASPEGPRGQGGLTKEELLHHQNGIWLCQKHASLVDANNGIGHPADKLFSYKRLQEHRAQKEILGLCSTIGWIDEFELIESPLFASGAKVKLGKLNLIFGDNSVGKTSFGRYLGGVFDKNHLKHWYSPGEIDLDFRVKYYNPDLVDIRFLVTKPNTTRYEINGNACSRNSTSCNVIVVPEFNEQDVFQENRDDKAFIANTLNIPDWEIAELVESINSYPYSNMRNYRFEEIEDSIGSELRLEIKKNGYPERSFLFLSSTEQKLVFIDFATALARKTSMQEPTLLILDCNLMSDVDQFQKFEKLLLSPENQFQTLLTVRLNGIDISDVQWRGWEVIRLYRENGSLTMFSQDPKMKVEPFNWNNISDE